MQIEQIWVTQWSKTFPALCNQVSPNAGMQHRQSCVTIFVDLSIISGPEGCVTQKLAFSFERASCTVGQSLLFEFNDIMCSSFQYSHITAVFIKWASFLFNLWKYLTNESHIKYISPWEAWAAHLHSKCLSLNTSIFQRHWESWSVAEPPSLVGVLVKRILVCPRYLATGLQFVFSSSLFISRSMVLQNIPTLVLHSSRSRETLPGDKEAPRHLRRSGSNCTKWTFIQYPWCLELNIRYNSSRQVISVADSMKRTKYPKG